MNVINGSKRDHAEIDFTVSGNRTQAESRNSLGWYYLTIGLLEDTTETSFQLSYDFYPQSTRRPKKIVPGNRGQILWETIDSESILLTWTEPQYEDGSPLLGTTVYRVEVTDNTLIPMDTVCSLRTAIENGTVGAVLSDYTNETSAVVMLKTGQIHVANVISTISTNTEAIYLSYTPTEVLLPTPTSPHSPKLLMIVGGSLTLLGLLALFIYWRKRRPPLEMQETGRAVLLTEIPVQTSKREVILQSMELGVV